MSTTQALADFVQNALGAGQSRDDISVALNKAGWTDEEIAKALGAWSDSDFIIPVPAPQPVASARDFFVYALTFGVLLFGAINLVFLLHEIIDILYEGRTRLRSLRWALSAVIVSGPLFFWLSYRDWIAVRANQGLQRSEFRKWMIYLAILGAIVALLGDLVGAIYALLEGDFTTQFFLKFLSVAVVAGAIFVYYRAEVRAGEAI